MVGASMVEPVKKSTEAIVQELVWSSDSESVFLDSRLALFGEKGSWLALSDLHYGFEVRRRAKGGLFPMWGRETIEARVDELLGDYQPEYLILNGDIVDGASSGCGEVVDWLKSLESKCGQLILIEGNHDRGPLLREMRFVRQFRIGEFLFHHGHLPRRKDESVGVEVVGHVHPCFTYRDGAGLSIKLPALIQEEKRWVMPAFSPWAGGVNCPAEEKETMWACSPGRIFPVSR
ncbi:MAG: metallophosphoesterase [Verrucomicrobiales bacterium]|nr:metallophosphoesterase [Verrucomicrobiales bacterium]